MRGIKSKGIKIYVIAVAAGLFITAVCAALFALLVLLGIKTAVFSVMAFAAGALACGFAAGLCGKRRGLLRGIKAALLFAAVLAVVAFVTCNAVEVFSRAVLAVLCGGIGGVLGVNR